MRGSSPPLAQDHQRAIIMSPATLGTDQVTLSAVEYWCGILQIIGVRVHKSPDPDVFQAELAACRCSPSYPNLRRTCMIQSLIQLSFRPHFIRIDHDIIHSLISAILADSIQFSDSISSPSLRQHRHFACREFILPRVRHAIVCHYTISL